uniref:G-protein coupled receptors family 1 profile domain-containing protein n=1 Tax=Pyxicephalus adspersus TaxID=30357 RepID=A0AAV3A141_PYXAD|nr:TPA: hypothetical protein GDO54_003307 [Pyxicephalus adspersus]
MTDVTTAGTNINYITNSVNGTPSPEKRTKLVLPILHITIVVNILVFLLGTTGNGLNCPFSPGSLAKLGLAVFYINLYASVFLISISIDRLICIKFPVWCRNHRTPRLASIVVLVMWTLALIFSLLHAIINDTAVAVSLATCVTLTRLIFGFVLPLIVFVSCYTLILLHIQGNYWTMSSKPSKLIAAVIMVFFICWVPCHVFSLLKLSIKYKSKEFNDDKDFMEIVHVGIQFSNGLATVNSCVNPVFYALVGLDFKEKLWSTIQSIFEKAFMEESE